MQEVESAIVVVVKDCDGTGRDLRCHECAIRIARRIRVESKIARHLLEHVGWVKDDRARRRSGCSGNGFGIVRRVSAITAPAKKARAQQTKRSREVRFDLPVDRSSKD